MAPVELASLAIFDAESRQKTGKKQDKKSFSKLVACHPESSPVEQSLRWQRVASRRADLADDSRRLAQY